MVHNVHQDTTTENQPVSNAISDDVDKEELHNVHQNTEDISVKNSTENVCSVFSIVWYYLTSFLFLLLSFEKLSVLYKNSVEEKRKLSEHKMRAKINEQKKQMKYLRQKISRMNKKAQKPRKIPMSELIAAIGHRLPSTKSQFIVQMHLRHARQVKWNKKEKEFSISLYLKSPRTYIYLLEVRKMALPCQTLIRNWINEVRILPGFNEQFFKILVDVVNHIEINKRDCVLMWDEMSMRELFEYNRRDDIIEGFEDLGDLGRTSKSAKKVLVFMLRGLRSNWKLPVAYFLSHTGVTKDNLAILISQCLTRVGDVGFKVRLLVCDQGSTNMGAASKFNISYDEPFIPFRGRKIYFAFDMPHLLKCIRNNLMNYDFLLDSNLISWDALKELRSLEKFNDCRAVPKLSDRHLFPNSFEKMNVKLAAQVFSHTVYAALCTGIETGELTHPSCKATAEFIKKMNKFFDCMIAPNDRNPYRRGLSIINNKTEKYLKKSLK